VRTTEPEDHQHAEDLAEPGSVMLEGTGPVGGAAGRSVRSLLTENLPGEAARELVAAWVDGELKDLSYVVRGGEVVAPVRRGSDVGRAILRHSTAHVLAQAVLDLWPGAAFAIGPAVDDGFYYDFLLPDGARFSEEDLAAIEERMRAIIAEDQPFEREEVSAEEGLEVFAGQPFKREIIQAVTERGAEDELASGEGAQPGSVSVYRNGHGFVDLCRGPHVPSTGFLGSFKLLRVAGAYWRGDEHRPQLQRIYGTAWEDDDACAAYLHRLEEAERRDHRRLGVEMDWFHFPPEIGSGLPVFHPKGARVRSELESFSRDAHLAHGYELVWTPHLVRSTLFERSGHLEWYAEGMYPPMEMEGATYYPKPMNCPLHILVYSSRSRSYRELPVRLFELGTVYRFERSGVLHGLARVRGLTQDDAHIFCTAEQLGPEIARVLRFVLEVLGAFGLGDFDAELSTRPEKYLGTLEEWDQATSALREALEQAGIPYRVAEGEGAFYAPKVDVHLRDAIGRRWQVSTVQVDFQLPRRFELVYTGADNAPHRPFMIHRALFGSVERFLAILIEHYAGALPPWLCPLQAVVVPVRDGHQGYAEAVRGRLEAAGIRAEVHGADEPVGARVRRARLERVPWILVVGDTDVAGETVGLNVRGLERPERDVPVAQAIEHMRSVIDARATTPAEPVASSR
jgi:threonyl-tRNA synthetase